MGLLRGWKELIQDGIDRGTHAVQQVHEDIAGTPLAVLQQIEPLAKHATGIREIQLQLIGSVYDSIRTVNRVVGDLAGEVIDKLEPE